MPAGTYHSLLLFRNCLLCTLLRTGTQIPSPTVDLLASVGEAWSTVLVRTYKYSTYCMHAWKTWVSVSPRMNVFFPLQKVFYFIENLVLSWSTAVCLFADDALCNTVHNQQWNTAQRQQMDLCFFCVIQVRIALTEETATSLRTWFWENKMDFVPEHRGNSICVRVQTLQQHTTTGVQ